MVITFLYLFVILGPGEWTEYRVAHVGTFEECIAAARVIRKHDTVMAWCRKETIK